HSHVWSSFRSLSQRSIHSVVSSFLFFSLPSCRPRSTLFPYTTLFRSDKTAEGFFQLFPAHVVCSGKEKPIGSNISETLRHHQIHGLDSNCFHLGRRDLGK